MASVQFNGQSSATWRRLAGRILEKSDVAFCTGPWRMRRTGMGRITAAKRRQGRALLPAHFRLPAPAQSGLFVDLFKAQDWYSALEDVALSALNVDFSVERLERALSEITSALAPADERAASAACDLIADLRGRTAVAAFACPAADVSQTVQAAASALFESAAASRSFWWHIGRDSAASDLHCAHGLPSPEVLRGPARCRCGGRVVDGGGVFRSVAGIRPRPHSRGTTSPPPMRWTRRP